MLIYYSIYALLIFGWIFQKDFANNKKGVRNYCIFAFLLIAGMLALRHPSMGWDLLYGRPNGYYDSFMRIQTWNWQKIFIDDFKNYEKGYVIFCRLLGYISKDPQILLIACAIISIAAISFIINRYSDNALFSFIIYLGLPVFLTNYSAMRQVLAIAITTFSFKFVEDKKLLRFIIAVLLASTFHSSAIIFLLAYFLYNVKFNRLMQYISIAVIPFVFLLRYPLFSVLSKLFKPEALPDDNNSITLFIVFTLVYLFTILFGNSDDSLSSGCRNLFWMACICQAFGGIYSTALRVGYYYMVFLMLLLPRVAKNLKYDESDFIYERNQIPDILIGLCFLLFGLYSIANGSWAMSNPYHFCWTNV